MILIQDNILLPADLESIRANTFASGFGTWTPAQADLGHKTTPGMNWQGIHAPLHVAIYNAMQQPIFPNHSFFKISTKDDNPSMVHSDRNDGPFTAIFYFTDHDYASGTGFYVHKETGLKEMPTPQQMEEEGTMEHWNNEMKDHSKFEQIDFIRGVKNRLLIFSAPLFHSRIPSIGQGETFEEGRMVWVCHFFTKESY